MDAIDGVFLNMINRSISAGWLILAVMVLRLFLKKSPKWVSCLLWAIVAVRLICPFSIESVFSLIPTTETLSPYMVQYSAKPVIDSGIAIVDDVVNPVFTGSFAPDPQHVGSINPLHGYIIMGAFIWLTGMAVLLIYAPISYGRVRKKVQEAVLSRENIWLCDNVKSPFILGIFRPRIYLPSGMEGEQIEFVLAHEHAHLSRKDHWWKPLGYLILVVYWFHPLMWAAYLLFCRDVELACDEKVIRNLDMSEKKAYSHALVSCSMQRKRVWACPLAFGEVGVKERVKTVLRYKKPAFWVRAAAVMACVIVAVCFLTNPESQADADEIQNENIEGTVAVKPMTSTGYTGYDELIAEAREALENHTGLPGVYPSDMSGNFSSVIYANWDYETLGYLIRDIDGNGVAELIFGENGEDGWDGIVYNIYTISDGAVVRILEGWERSRYYLCENGCIAHEGSDGAGDNIYNYYRLNGAGLAVVESVKFHVVQGTDGFRNEWLYSTESDEYESDPESYQPIDSEQAQEIMSKYVYERPKFIPFID